MVYHELEYLLTDKQIFIKQINIEKLIKKNNSLHIYKRVL